VDLLRAVPTQLTAEEPSDDETVRRELDEFERVIERHQRDVLRLCYAICGDGERARDAAQRTWLEAWRARRQVRDPERIRSWLATIALREARREVGRSRRRSVRELPASTVDPGVLDRTTAIQPPAADPDLAQALAGLDPDDRAIVTLRYVLGFDSFEIGRMTGRSPSGTRARLARLLARLRDDLREEDGDD
jgi:RNA polymerase sigma-70 factor (ECF subfamily)